MALKKRPLVDVQVPFGDADGEVAERVWGDVDTADSEAISLHRRKTSVVPNDVSDRIGHCSSRWVARRLVEPTGAHNGTHVRLVGHHGPHIMPVMGGAVACRLAAICIG